MDVVGQAAALNAVTEPAASVFERVGRAFHTDDVVPVGNIGQVAPRAAAELADAKARAGGWGLGAAE
jgi:hypothetical protein